MSKALLLHELEALGSKLLHHIFVDDFGAPGGVDLDDTILAIEHVDYRHARLDESGEPLFDALLVIISTSAGLASVQESGPHSLLGAVEEQGELAGHNRLLELDSLVHLPGETIDKELAVAVLLNGGLHGVLQQLDGDLHRHDLAVLDVALDHLAELAARTLLLLAQKVAGRQVLETVVAHKVGALRALAGARTTEDEDDESLVLAGTRREERLGTLHSREGRSLEDGLSGRHCCDCLAAGECLVACGVPRPVLLGLGGVVGDGLVSAGSTKAVAGLCDVVEAAAAEDEDEDEGSDGELVVVCAAAWDWRGFVVAGDLGLCRVLEEAAGGGEAACGGGEELRAQGGGGEDAGVHCRRKYVVE